MIRDGTPSQAAWVNKNVKWPKTPGCRDAPLYYLAQVCSGVAYKNDECIHGGLFSRIKISATTKRACSHCSGPHERRAVEWIRCGAAILWSAVHHGPRASCSTQPYNLSMAQRPSDTVITPYYGNRKTNPSSDCSILRHLAVGGRCSVGGLVW